MKLKTILIFIAFCLITIQFNMTSCSSSTDPDNALDNASVKDPTNNYQVVTEVISFGGLGGCSIGAISNPDGVVENADFKINDVTLDYQNVLYGDTLFLLSYLPGTEYTLRIRYENMLIASGKALMPATPVISNANTMSNHDLHTPLKVNWPSVENAHSLQISITAEIYDPVSQQEIFREYESPLLSPLRGSHTIPDTFFTYAGEYTLGLIAYYGVNPGFTIDDSDDPGYTQSYNMDGAAGVFIAVNLSSPEGQLITVGNPASNAKAAARSFKEVVLEKHKQYFSRQFVIKK